MEIKGTVLKETNIIHITNNELNSATRNKDNYYIVIVVFKNNSECVDKVYRIKNPIKSFKINESELLKILYTKKIGYAEIYEQQFILNLDVNVLGGHLLGENELLL